MHPILCNFIHGIEIMVWFIDAQVVPLKNKISHQAICLIPFQNSVVNLDAGEVKSILDLSIHSTLQAQGLSVHDCLLYVVSVATTRPKLPESNIQDPFNTWRSEAVVMLGPWKDVQFQDPKVHASNYQQEDNKTIKFTLVTTAVVSHVGVESNLPGKFSDNVLLLLPWSPKDMIFRSTNPITLEAFKKSFEIFIPVAEASAGEWVVVDDDFP